MPKEARTMSTKTLTITPALARTEIARRTAKTPFVGERNSAAHVAFGMGGDALRAIAGQAKAEAKASIVATATPKAPKVTTPKATTPETLLRREAFAISNAATKLDKAGRKALYVAELAKRGLRPVR
jgi:hypothetical protein